MRTYKTGDLVKYDKKKDLIYFIKEKTVKLHMGYRLELNELEMVIGRMPLVKEVCIFCLKKKKSFWKITAVIASDKKIKDLTVIKYIKIFTQLLCAQRDNIL